MDMPLGHRGHHSLWKERFSAVYWNPHFPAHLHPIMTVSSTCLASLLLRGEQTQSFPSSVFCGTWAVLIFNIYFNIQINIDNLKHLRLQVAADFSLLLGSQVLHFSLWKFAMLRPNYFPVTLISEMVLMEIQLLASFCFLQDLSV